MNPSTDPQLDHVLAVMRSVEPPAHMQHRLLANLEAHHIRPKPLRWSLWLFASGMVAATVLLVLALPVGRHLPNQHRGLGMVIMKPPQTVTTPSPQFETAAIATTNHHHKARIAAHPKLSAEEQLALEETNAPSKPAPPLPLTQQERLMLRVIYRGNSIQLAQLDPAKRDAALAAEQKQFHDFFAHPQHGDHP